MDKRILFLLRGQLEALKIERDGAGRGEYGRHLAVVCTMLEKVIAYLAYWVVREGPDGAATMAAGVLPVPVGPQGIADGDSRDAAAPAGGHVLFTMRRPGGEKAGNV